MFESDGDFDEMNEENEDSTCTVCLKASFFDLVEPVRTNCNHIFCWYVSIGRFKYKLYGVLL